MKLEAFLSEKRPVIIRKWFDVIMDTYPVDASNYLKKQENRFINPIGHTILQGVESIYDELISGIDTERVSPFLDNIIRIRAVQDFSASEAVSFIFSLKKIIQEEVGGDKQNDVPYTDLLEFDSRIDILALLSFDIFMKCKEKIYDIRANELRNMTFRIIQRANKQDKSEEVTTDLSSGNSENVKQGEVTK